MVAFWRGHRALLRVTGVRFGLLRGGIAFCRLRNRDEHRDMERGLGHTCAVSVRATVPSDLLGHLRRARDMADRHYAEPLDLQTLANAAGMSKYHFLRSFAVVYGQTPAQYLSHRRVERAQDLLRATNLTVTEICHLVGFTSVGSFSQKFRDLVGVSPSAYQARYAQTGAPRIPGCYVFMHGLCDRAISEKPAEVTVL